MPACPRFEAHLGGRRPLLALLAVLTGLALAAAPPAHAHATSQAYLQLRGDGQQTQLQADMALRDLDAALDLDADGDAQLTWGELRRAEPLIQAWLAQGVSLVGCRAAWQPGPLALVQRGDGLYARVNLAAPCALPSAQPLHYQLLGEVDTTHRALLRTERAGLPVQASLLKPSAPQATPAPEAEAPTPFWQEGVHHLVTGYDHLLFLLCLLLPALALGERRRGGTAHTMPVLNGDPPFHPPLPASGAGEIWHTLRPIAGWVTAFTLAHSLTLGLAVLAGLRVPGSVVEPLIAASIVLAAVDNLRPFLHRALGLPRWGVAMAFGLVHGFGFAGALGELDLPPAALAWALFQFNLGLELAQLAVVGVGVALLWRLRRWSGYQRWVQGLGSSLAAVLGTVWVWQRVAS
jgi:hypothetical protein